MNMMKMAMKVTMKIRPKGRVQLSNQMNYRKNSKRPSTPPLLTLFRKFIRFGCRTLPLGPAYLTNSSWCNSEGWSWPSIMAQSNHKYCSDDGNSFLDEKRYLAFFLYSWVMFLRVLFNEQWRPPWGNLCNKTEPSPNTNTNTNIDTLREFVQQDRAVPTGADYTVSLDSHYLK